MILVKQEFRPQYLYQILKLHTTLWLCLMASALVLFLSFSVRSGLTSQDVLADPQLEGGHGAASVRHFLAERKKPR